METQSTVKGLGKLIVGLGILITLGSGLGLLVAIIILFFAELKENKLVTAFVALAACGAFTSAGVVAIIGGLWQAKYGRTSKVFTWIFFGIIFAILILGCLFSAFLKSFDLLFVILGLISFLIFLIGAPFFVYRIIKSVNKRQERSNLMEEKVLPKIGSKFGKVISVEASNFNRLIRFERNETLFELKVTPLFDSDGSPTQTENKVQFSLPNLHEKFYVQHKSFFGSNYPSDCPKVQVTMPNDFIFHSLNPQFLSNLMQNEKIRSEVYKYQKKVSRKFSVAFENGVLTIIWNRGPNDGEFTWDNSLDGETSQNEAQKLEQICQTAVVFYDELAKK